MQKFLALFLILFVSFGVVVTDAHAARFGGGRSFGMSRSASSFSSFKRPAAMPAQNRGALGGNRWLGPLAGLAAGGLLASLFMGNGIANGLMTWLLVGAGILLLMNLIRGFSRQKAQPDYSRQTHQMFNANAARNDHASTGFQPFVVSGSQSANPADFDEIKFLRDAKVQFIRLQAAYDQKNLQDISEFTTPEVFAEVKLQLQERGQKDNQTDVLTLDAELLDMTQEFQGWVASVRFTGSIREERDQPAIALNEIWHFRKNAAGRDKRNIQFFSLKISVDFLEDVHQIVFGPVHAESQVTSRQRTFYHDKIGQAVEFCVFAQKNLQRAHGGDDDAQLRIAETRMILHQRKRAQMQTGTQRNAVDSGAEGLMQTHAQRLARRIHREFFHAVDEDHAGAALGFHRFTHVHTRCLGNLPEIKFHVGFIRIGNVVLVLLGLFLDEFGLVAPVRYSGQHRIGKMPYPAQARNLKRQLSGRNIHTHPAYHNGHQLMLAKLQAKIIYALHQLPFHSNQFAILPWNALLCFFAEQGTA